MNVAATLLFATGAAVLGQACAPPDGLETEAAERTGRDHAAVKDGTATEGDLPVVGIYKDAVILCTGTLVSPRVVLTAAHCVHPDMLSGHDITELEVRVGTNVFSPDDKANVVEGLPHPEWHATTMNLAGNPDIGLLRIDAPLGIEPLLLPTPEVSALLVADAPLRVVGYGVTDFGLMDYGTKREADTTIESITSDAIELSPASMCAGDSGGPYLFERGGGEYVVAVHSNGNCTTSSGGSRVDVVLDSFVRPFIEVECVADGECLSYCVNTIDPDCVCAADDGCNPDCPVEVGDPDCACIADDECDDECPEGVVDPDCEDDTGPGSEESAPPPDEGCGLAPAAIGTGWGHPWLALAALYLMTWRRRARSPTPCP